MPSENMSSYKANEQDDQKITEFRERHGIPNKPAFLRFVVAHLDLLEAAFNSSQLGTHSGDGTLSQIVTRLQGSEKVLCQYEHQLQPDIFLTADLGDCKVWHVNNVRFNESVQYPSLFPEPENWTVEQRLDYFHRLETEGKLYGNACFGVRNLYNARRDFCHEVAFGVAEWRSPDDTMPLDFNDDPKIKTKYGYITQVFLEYHPWYVHPEWCDFHLLRDLDHERILFPER